MDGFTLVDAGVAVIIVLSAILAYSRGLVREVLAIAGWVGAAVLAFVFAAQAEPLIKEIPVVGDYLRGSCELARLAAYAVVFAAGLVIMALITPLFSALIQRSALSGIDMAFGFLFGVVRGVILVAVAFVVYDRAVPENTVPMVDSSRSAAIFATFQDRLEAGIPSDAPGWIVERYEALVGDCAAPAAN